MSAHRWGTPGLSRTVRIPCPGIQLNVRPEVAPLFAELVRWLTAERRKTGAPPLTSAGGYIKRRVRGGLSWSNHSWGLAADFNPDTNPMQMRLKTDMPPGTSAKAKSLGMRWGGDYVGRKDPMHFEVVASPAEVARIVERLTKPKPAPISEDDDMTPEQADRLERIEAMLDALTAKRRPDKTDADPERLSLADLYTQDERKHP